MTAEMPTRCPTKKPVHLFYRDPMECIESLVRSPYLANHIHYTPMRVYEAASEVMRVYSEWMTGDAAWSMQVTGIAILSV